MGRKTLGAAYVIGWEKGEGHVPLSVVSKENFPSLQPEDQAWKDQIGRFGTKAY